MNHKQRRRRNTDESTPRPGQLPPDPAKLLATAQGVAETARVESALVALAGGLAMSLYGSPRLTHDVDFVASADFKAGRRVTALTFGGTRYEVEGIHVDLIVRADEYAELYEDSLAHTRRAPDASGLRIVSPEFLVAMKLAANRPKDMGDLVWLLQQKKLVNRKKAAKIVGKFLGGRFAVDTFLGLADEADWLKTRDKPDVAP